MATRIAEKVTVLREHGHGLLLRMYNMKKGLEPKTGKEIEPKTLATTLTESKTLAQFVKHALGAKKVSQLTGTPKLVEELCKIKQTPMWAELLDLHIETLFDVMDFYQSLWTVFDECSNGHTFHLVRTPTLTSNYLELVHLYGALGIMLSRVPYRKVIIAMELILHSCRAQKGVIVSNQDPVAMSELAQFLWQFDDPLEFLYFKFEHFTETLRVAFLSVSLIYVKQCSSASQWRKESFLQLPPTFEVSEIEANNQIIRDTMDVTSCLGYPPGTEYATLEELERWLFWGFLFCHQSVEVGEKEGGEYKIWCLVLQSMWVMPLVRDEVLRIHDALTNFFRQLVSKYKKEKSAAKKIPELKTMYNTALKSAPSYRTDRRLFISQLLKDYWLYFRECPGLLGPRFPHLLKLLSLARAEIHWLLRHEANLPTKKQELQLLAGGNNNIPVSKLLRCPNFPEFVYFTLSVWSFAESKELIIRKYFADHVFGFDVPELHATLRGELEGRSPSFEGQNEVSNLMCSLDDALAIAKKIFCKDLEEEEEDDFPDLLNEDGTIDTRKVETVLRNLKMDAMRFQVLLARRAHSTSSSAGTFKTPLASLSKLSDVLLMHSKFALGGSNEKKPSDLSQFLDLSFLTLGYQKQFGQYFAMCIASASGCKYSGVFPMACAFYPAGCHSLCPEDWIRSEQKSLHLADFFFTKISSTLFEAFFKWCDHQICINLSLGLPQNLAQKTLKKFKNPNDKKKEVPVAEDPVQEMALLIKECQRDNFSLDNSFQIVANLCWAFNNCLEIHPSLNPKEIFLQGLKKNFEDYLTNCTVFGAGENRTHLFPSVVESKLMIFVTCVFTMSQHIDFDAPYWCSSLLQSIKSFQFQAGENYINSFYNFVKSNLIERNLLCYSETFGEFVMPPGVDDWKEIEPDKYLKVHRLEVWLSSSELESLVRLYGTEGIDYLCDAILTKGIIENAKKWLTLGQRLKNQHNLRSSTGKRAFSDGSINSAGTENITPEIVSGYTEILNFVIRIGMYFNLRKLLLVALDKVSQAKIPYIYSMILKILPKVESDHLPEGLGAISDLIGRPPLIENTESQLVEILQKCDWMTRQDLAIMMSSLASALPHASKFVSSFYVADAVIGSSAPTSKKQEAGSQSLRRQCIDSHFNNLNCIATTVAHFFTAAIEATADDSSNLGQREIFESFLSQFVNNMRDYAAASTQTHKKEEFQNMLCFDSVLLILSLVAEKSPTLNVAILENHFPLPIWILERSKRRTADRKLLRSLSIDVKSINPSKAGAIKNNWNSTLAEAMI